jgi:hypothetical protein
MQFVHGVATRRGTEYEEGVRARDALLREYVYDRLRLDRGIPVTSAYWGDDAAEFRWDQASVPTEGVEAFGPATPLEDAELDRDDRALVPVAAADPEAAFDLPWAASVVDVDDATVDALPRSPHAPRAFSPGSTGP